MTATGNQSDAADAMLREAIRAAGWDRAMQFFDDYTMLRADTALQETIMDMRARFQDMERKLDRMIKP